MEIVKALWAGETLDYAGEYFSLKQGRQAAAPLGKIPIVIGGAGPRTLELVAAHADWWNVHVGILDRVEPCDPMPAPPACRSRCRLPTSTTRMSEMRRWRAANRRFGPGPVAGSGPELIDYFATLAEHDIERAYVWFCDFSPTDTVTAFGETVISHIG